MEDNRSFLDKYNKILNQLIILKDNADYKYYDYYVKMFEEKNIDEVLK